MKAPSALWGNDVKRSPGPGAGVFGRGGVNLPPPGFAAAGVIGLAGDVSVSAMSGSANTRVLGQRNVGPGVLGRSRLDRGAIFSSDRGPQINLIPLKSTTLRTSVYRRWRAIGL
jgi:hypothetical protein